MGICLDTEQNNEEVESAGERTRGPSAWAGRATPPTAGFPMQNTSQVKFEPPNCPVIFVLGGPGSGKVTHCDNLMQERRGMVHINMTDLLQQYAIGNGKKDDMQDFGNLSSKTVTEVLMLEMKMAPTAKTYLVSGYPRSMRDVAEYSDKIQTINGVVLVSWRQRVLERQIEYGARLGHVVLSLARMELGNFYRHVMPVADYFDQANLLIAVNGERNPEEVYKDFRAAVLQILGSTDDQNGISGIPGEIVGVEPVPERDHTIEGRGVEERASERRDEAVIPAVPIPIRQPVSLPVGQPSLPAAVGSPMSLPTQMQSERVVTPKAEVIRVRGAMTTPVILWVVGGPGSNKAALCQRAVSQHTGWTHFSLGQRLRAIADAGGGPASDGALARTAISGGELAPKELVSKLVRIAVTDASMSGHGLVLDGYPRDLDQMKQFQSEFRLTPRMVLLDCSKLQLGRGRRDDSVAAFRRRLEVFRELSLPMLKTLDQDHRLMIVDGDTDSPDVQAEFTRVLIEEMEKAEAIAAMPQHPPPTTVSRTDNKRPDYIQDAMGSMDRWQIVIAIALSLKSFPPAWNQLAIAVIAPRQDFTCVSPPQINSNVSMYRACFVKVNESSPEVACTAFTYDDSTFKSTIISEMDDLAYWVVPFTYGVGPIIGATLCLWLPETMGRKLPETIEDGENMHTSTMQQFTHAVSRMGGTVANGHANGAIPNGAVHNGTLPNGIGNGFLTTNKVKPMMENAAKISTVSQMTHDDVRRLYEQSTGDLPLNTHI